VVRLIEYQFRWSHRANDILQRDQVIPRPSTKINNRQAAAALPIQITLAGLGRALRPGSRGPIMLERLSRPAFAPSVDGSAAATTWNNPAGFKSPATAAKTPSVK